MKRISLFLNAILILAYRDVRKLLTDKARIVGTFIFPFIFIGILGSSLQSNLGSKAGFNFLAFTFTGVLAQTLFQSAASGVVSLIEDRENDFSQEMFVAPISRYAIIVGKIVGESCVAFIQAFGIILFGYILGVSLSPTQLIAMLPIMVISCLFGASFGIFVLSNLSSQRAANQVFTFVFFPQFFLSGVFSPIKSLPFWLAILSHLTPMTYAVDLMRIVYFQGTGAYSKVVTNAPFVDFIVVILMFLLFISVGTALFVRNERNK